MPHGRATRPTGCRWTSATGGFNLRASNTEPLLRLNVEARGDAGLVERGVAQVRALVATG